MVQSGLIRILKKHQSELQTKNIFVEKFFLQIQSCAYFTGRHQHGEAERLGRVTAVKTAAAVFINSVLFLLLHIQAYKIKAAPLASFYCVATAGNISQ